MTFGLWNAAQTFQRFMDHILRDLDFVMASTSVEEHQEHLKTLLQHLWKYKLSIHPVNCSFGVGSLDFLGYHVSGDGITPLPQKEEAIKDYPQPTTVRKLWEFLGMVTFYHRFLPHLADTLAPLNELNRNAPKN